LFDPLKQPDQNNPTHLDPASVPPPSEAAPVLPAEIQPADPQPDELDFLESTYQTSPADPADLTDWLTGPEEESTPPPVQPIYQISPAEPDWAVYTQPDLPSEPPMEEKPSLWRTAWAVTREVGETIILTLIIFFLIQTVIRNFRVVGTSMVNNLHDGQYLIIDKLTYSALFTDMLGLGGPQRGDVIVFEPPNRPGEDYVKRIIGLPGETVEIKQGQVFINGQPLAEPFQPMPGTYTMPNPVVVPEGQLFVLGDNRNNSNDSHNWGTLPVEKVVGRAWLSYWPPNEWGVIPRDQPTEQATLRYFVQELVPSANAGNQ
jgi:signal peptidase I